MVVIFFVLSSSSIGKKSFSLANELWSKAFSYLDHKDLSTRLGNVNRSTLYILVIQ